MSLPKIINERRGAITIIRLKDLENHNAFSQRVVEELSDVFNRLQADDDLRAVVLTGEGSVFCIDRDLEESSKDLDSQRVLFDRIVAFPVPIIAAISGDAAGAGCELALACHLRLASSNASFSLPGRKRLNRTNDAVTQRLLRDVGQRPAVEAMLMGRTLPAAEAYRMGLINAVSEPSLLLTDTLSLADEIAQLAPLAIRACLRAVTEGCELTLEEGLELETKLFARLFATNDMREGTRAFLEKRKPVFNGT